MSSDPSLKRLLRQGNLAPHRQLGQNFLINPEIPERIVELAALTPDDTVVEVGVGMGALTLPLARRVKKVVGIEIDSGIVRWHRQKGDLPANVELVHADILKLDLAELAARCGGRLKLVANLPYSVSSPVLFALLDHRRHVDTAVVMLQKEVADRLTARVSTREYGAITVRFALCAAIEQVLQVGPGNFHPRPKVASTVVAIHFRDGSTDADEDAAVATMVKTAFLQRRKTVVNALAPLFSGKQAVLDLLNGCAISPRARADQLAPEQYLALARAASARDFP
ncbi:MAG: 16S rRNA (adenine(1518)-N(6)/adenine(1519)-N(6))-dimethyltransferase RsmA [Thermodesulfobacteriota bacterium]